MKLLSIPLLLLLIFGCQPGTSEKQADVRSTVDTTTTPVEAAEQVPANPPAEIMPPIDYDTAQWTEVIRLDPTLVLDLRYATDSNFVEEQMYDCGRCFLRPEVARAVVKVHEKLQEQGLGIKLLDCYRPRPVQWKLWEKVPDPRYVTDPRKGSYHNRGTAVDLTIVDSLGNQLDMGTPFDFFGHEAYPAYTDHPQQVLDNRKLLHETMKSFGFKPIRTEWWHFSYPGKRYALSDMLWKCY
jgi:D-alanyl-D-alanine dipeptidase